MKQYVVDIADLGSERLHVGGVFPAGSLDLGQPGAEQAGDVSWSAFIERQRTRVRLVGELHGTLGLACVRCLEPTQLAVSRQFDLFFEQHDELMYEEDEEIELDEPDMQTAFLAGTELNLADVITEQLILSLPMKPLCRNDCKGLCAECGHNLNVAPCDCTVPVVHPAFDVLVELKNRMERG
jgi:DUF177 domain-containing protein